jgi:phage-related protein
MKPVAFIGRALSELKAFPDAARREAGFQIFNLQNGVDPDDWKPLVGVGPGVMEIRIHEGDEFRVVYVARMPEALYVIHAFQKKSQATAKRNLETIKRRYAVMLKERESP